MKVKSAVKKMCKYCKIVIRRRTVYVRCTANPRHKQRQGMSTIAHEGPLPLMLSLGVKSMQEGSVIRSLREGDGVKSMQEGSVIRSLREGLASLVSRNGAPAVAPYMGSLGLAALLDKPVN